MRNLPWMNVSLSFQDWINICSAHGLPLIVAFREDEAIPRDYNIDGVHVRTVGIPTDEQLAKAVRIGEEFQSLHSDYYFARIAEIPYYLTEADKALIEMSVKHDRELLPTGQVP